MSESKLVSVMEIFHSIQGEGLQIGSSAIFVRFGGCDSRCTKCDTMYAVDPEQVNMNARRMTIQNILEEITNLVKETGINTVILTGGNPAIQPLGELVEDLRHLNIYVAIETQGTFWTDWIFYCNEIVISPKGPGMGNQFKPEEFDKFLTMVRNHINWQIKIPVFSAADLEFAKDIADRIGFGCPFDMVLSLGNPYVEGTTYDVSKHANMQDALLRHYRVLMEDILSDNKLRNFRVLPQFHTLLWGNERGK